MPSELYHPGRYENITVHFDSGKSAVTVCIPLVKHRVAVGVYDRFSLTKFRSHCPARQLGCIFNICWSCGVLILQLALVMVSHISQN